MSYIPKYILKRMIPKDAVKVVGDNLEIAMTNVISPISIDEVPDDVIQYLEVKMDDETVVDASKPDLMAKLIIRWEEKEFTLANLADAVGETLPVGGKMTVVVPNVKGYAAGDKHDFEVTIKADNPINIKFNRVVG